MAELHVLRVFTGEEGEWGNPLGVFLNGAEIPPAERLRPPAGEVEVRREGELTFVAAEAEWSPPWRLFKLGGPRAVEALAGPPAGAELAYLWAWEDEAAGSAAIMLAAALGRELTIHQGRGSVLCARPLGGGRAEVGGRVVLDERRDYRTAG